MSPYTVPCSRCGHPGKHDQINLFAADAAPGVVPPWLARCTDTDACDQRIAARQRAEATGAVRAIVLALHEAGYVHTAERGEHRWQLDSPQISENITHWVTYEPAPETLPGQTSLIIRHGDQQIGWDGVTGIGHAAELLVLAGVLARCLRCSELVAGNVVECARCAATSDAIAYDNAVDAAEHGRHAAHEAA